MVVLRSIEPRNFMSFVELPGLPREGRRTAAADHRRRDGSKETTDCELLSVSLWFALRVSKRVREEPFQASR